jgi:Uri superfamily endonuclease
MKGIYILLIKISRTAKAKIGSLGEITLPKGTYAYVGSAQNSLEKRIARHKSKNKKIFWHIDYVLALKCAKIIKVFCKKAGKAEECKTARKLSKTGTSVKNFGCSDCKCESHFFRIKNNEKILGKGMDYGEF